MDRWWLSSEDSRPRTGVPSGGVDASMYEKALVSSFVTRRVHAALRPVVTGRGILTYGMTGAR